MICYLNFAIQQKPALSPAFNFHIAYLFVHYLAIATVPPSNFNGTSTWTFSAGVL